MPLANEPQNYEGENVINLTHDHTSQSSNHNTSDKHSAQPVDSRANNLEPDALQQNWILNVGQEYLKEKVELMKQEWDILFKVGVIYDTTYSVFSAALAFAEKHNIVMTIASHHSPNDIEITCKHGGIYRSHKKKETSSPQTIGTETKKTRKRKSMKTGCPCIIIAKYVPSIMKVEITQSVFKHNHPLAEDPRTYALNRRLDVNQFDTAKQLLKKHKPASVLQVFNHSN